MALRNSNTDTLQLKMMLNTLNLLINSIFGAKLFFLYCSFLMSLMHRLSSRQLEQSPTRIKYSTLLADFDSSWYEIIWQSARALITVVAAQNQESKRNYASPPHAR
jgi:hypothetical protein